jgi:hypothetical protein
LGADFAYVIDTHEPSRMGPLCSIKGGFIFCCRHGATGLSATSKGSQSDIKLRNESVQQ